MSPTTCRAPSSTASSACPAPGTEHLEPSAAEGDPPLDRRRLAGTFTVGQLTAIGWLLLGAPFGMIAFQVERVRDVGPQQFATVWEQRIEVLSFLVLPPNLVALAPAVLAAVVATLLAGREREPWLDGLLGLSAAAAAAMAVIGVVSVISTLAGDNFAGADLGGVYMRVGGTSMALALLLACWIAHRAAPD